MQLGVQGQSGPKLGELSVKESTWILNPLRQGTRLVRIPNVYVTNKYCTILPYNGEKTIKVKCPEKILSDPGITLTFYWESLLPENQ